MIAKLLLSAVRRSLTFGCGVLFAAGATAGEIHDAVLVHDLDRVRQLLLEKPALVNERTEKGDTPLYIACFRGYVKQMVPLLLQFGADPNPPPNLRMETPLSIAREQNLKQTAALLLKAGAREDELSRGAEVRYLTTRRDAEALSARLAQFPSLVNTRNAYGQTPLAIALADDRPDLNVILALLNRGANPNATNSFGGTPYSVAVENERTNLISLLLKHGAKETAITRSAPLRIAARKNLLPEAEALVKQTPGLVNERDDLRRAPLHLAGSGAGLPLVELLLKSGAEVNARDFADNTPLHAAALAGKADVVSALLARQADVNAANRQRVTPLHHAALAGSLPAVEALLGAGADVKATDNVGETALHRAATGGHVPIVKLLLERGLDVNLRDRQRQTPLHQAAQSGRVEAVKFLLSRTANPAFTDVTGSTALALSEKLKHEDVVKLLRTGPPK
ncbi:MAG: ankyrin repeat domain-containing protein [Limisphaerales bacterium]